MSTPGLDDQVWDLKIERIAQQAITLAADLVTRANATQTPAERTQGAKLARMMDDPEGKDMTMALSDQVFRSHNARRIADQLAHIIATYGVPHYLAWWERLALAWGTKIAQLAPQLVVPFIVAKLRQETRQVILSGEERPLEAYLRSRYTKGTRLNLNHLGEAILGEAEAAKRLEAYSQLLKRPDVEYISVKISSIYSQINLLAYQATLEAIKVRLRELYRVAMQHSFQHSDGQQSAKFVNLDMEEYRDLHLTLDAFVQVLDEDEFFHYAAGIVLQAYLPDSFAAQQRLTSWAQQRSAKGGAAIKIRLVKGANLAMEQVEASRHGWAQAPYMSKAEVDANYKRMVIYGMTPERAQAVRLGIASHNIFDLAFALTLREATGVGDNVEFEMLEGMANHQARVIQEAAGGLLLYAPIVKQADFHSAIAYLVRRLDENTAKENFLHDLFGLAPGSGAWETQRTAFLEAVRHAATVKAEPNRQQNRLSEDRQFHKDSSFVNEPDTDFSLAANRTWARAIVEQWQGHEPSTIPIQVAGDFVVSASRAEGHDPSRPGQRAYDYSLADREQLDLAVRSSKEAQASWQALGIEGRKELLLACAMQLVKNRAELIGSALFDGGKTILQADVEVSEAIDFANYYARSLDLLTTELADVRFAPLGTVLVTPPWNFPIAIPCGGVLAALMAGNCVLLKPAPEAVLVAWTLVQCLWQAGIPKMVLQFVPTSDDDVGKHLVTHPDVDAVILTGAYETARLFHSWKPELKLFAETSGKNSMIVSALADHDQAIKELVYSAFGHNGQKCSAASLAVLEAEVYDNPAFLRQLKDAAESLTVASAWDTQSHITPLIRRAGPELERGLTTLEAGESWLLEPQPVADHPHLWSPGIKLGVTRGSWYHQQECFGPVLGLIRAEDIEDAIAIVNDSELGLTSGIQSLDDREITLWRERIEAGNAYVNRATTGAVVQRQPFGGWKRSAFGTGAKAGGVNYVLSLGSFSAKAEVPEMPMAEPADSVLTSLAVLATDDLVYTAKRYAHAWKTHFALAHDPSQVLGESNIFRYRPLKNVFLRLQSGDDLSQAAKVVIAAQTCGVPLLISAAEDVQGLEVFEKLDLDLHLESSEDFAKRLEGQLLARIRVLSPLATDVLVAAQAAHVPVIDAAVLANGRLELRFYLLEQALSESVHRYGNIQKHRLKTL